MKKLLLVLTCLIWAATSYGNDLGEGATGQSSWVGKGPDYFLNSLPTPPRDGCPGKNDNIKPFRENLLKTQKELQDEIGKRRRALKKWNEQNSKKMMENAVDMPGFAGKSQDEMKKMSKAERKKMAEKMMQDKFGIDLKDLKKQKKANESAQPMDAAEYDKQMENFEQQYGDAPDGTKKKKPKKARDVAANVDFAKTMAGEMQANDLMKSQGEREADKRKIAGVGKLTKEQADLSKKLHLATEGRAISLLDELDKDKQAKGMRESIYDKENELAKMLGTAYKRPKDVDYSKIMDVLRNQGKLEDGYQSNMETTNFAAELDALPQITPHETGDGSSCQAKEDQCSSIYTERMSYCSYMAPKLLKIVNEWYGALVNSQRQYLELDRINSELQKAQTGIALPDASRGLSGLEAIQRYTGVLGYAYRYDPGTDRCKDLFCGGEQPGSSGESH